MEEEQKTPTAAEPTQPTATPLSLQLGPKKAAASFDALLPARRPGGEVIGQARNTPLRAGNQPHSHDKRGLPPFLEGDG